MKQNKISEWRITWVTRWHKSHLAFFTSCKIIFFTSRDEEISQNFGPKKLALGSIHIGNLLAVNYFLTFSVEVIAKKWVHHPLMNLLVQAKVNQIVSVNVSA